MKKEFNCEKGLGDKNAQNKITVKVLKDKSDKNPWLSISVHLPTGCSMSNQWLSEEKSLKIAELILQKNKNKKLKNITPKAEVEIMEIGENASLSGTFLEPYVGYEAIVITQPDGSVDWVMDGELRNDGAKYIEYFKEKESI